MKAEDANFAAQGGVILQRANEHDCEQPDVPILVPACLWRMVQVVLCDVREKATGPGKTREGCLGLRIRLHVVENLE